MILDVFAFRNKRLKCYANPYFAQDKIENVEVNLTRTIAMGGDSAKAKYAHLALYHFGTFDDVSGEYNLLSQAELVCDCDDIIAGLPEGE